MALQPNTHERFNVNIFKNTNKREDKQPDFTGNLEIDGKPYQIAMWDKGKDKNGNTFYSLSFSPNNYVKKPTPQSSKQDDNDNPFDF